MLMFCHLLLLLLLLFCALQEPARQAAATLRNIQARLAEHPLVKDNAKLLASNIEEDEQITKLADRANKLAAQKEVRR
jgi:cell division protein FtsB